MVHGPGCAIACAPMRNVACFQVKQAAHRCVDAGSTFLRSSPASVPAMPMAAPVKSTPPSVSMLNTLTTIATISHLLALSPMEIVTEEQRRGRILEQLNKLGIRDLRSINEFCKEYYDNPDRAVQRISLPQT